MKQKGKASSTGVAMVMIILVQARVISIAAQDQENNNNITNGTNNNYFIIGIIENDNDFEYSADDEFPDAVSSHIHRRVLQSSQGMGKTMSALNAEHIVFPKSKTGSGNYFLGSAPENTNKNILAICKSPYSYNKDTRCGSR